MELEIKNEFIVENLKIRFKDLNTGEGLRVSSALMSCVKNSDSENVSEQFDIGKFMNKSFELICQKLEIETEDASGDKSFKSVGNSENLSLFFKNPLISVAITTSFLEYISPFFLSLIK